MSCACGEPRRPNPCGCSCQCNCSCDHDENRPGLDAVKYGAVRYDAVFRSMRDRLSGADLPALAGLTARGSDESIDPAIALLDGWACVSEILSFYNERAVNECFLRTCTERYSAVELARLVGYSPRPGVAADAYLAFTLDDLNKEAVLKIPTGTRAYSLPAPGGTMQPFETDEMLTGRPRWSQMRPRLTLPQWLVIANPRRISEDGPIPQDVTDENTEIWFKGISTGLAPSSVLLFDFGVNGKRGRAVASVEPMAKGSESRYAPILEDLTRVALQPSREFSPPTVEPTAITDTTIGKLIDQPGFYTGSRERLTLEPADIFADESYAPIAMLGSAYPALQNVLPSAVGGTAPKGATGNVAVYAMRVKAAIHGHNAQLIALINEGDGKVVEYLEWNIEGTGSVRFEGDETVPPQEFETLLRKDRPAEPLATNEIALDSVYDGILPGTQVVILLPENERLEERILRARETVDEDRVMPLTFDQERVFHVRKIETVTRTQFNLPSRVSLLTLDRPWNWDGDTHLEQDFGRLRKTVVYAQSDVIELVDRPIRRPVKNEKLVLDGYYPGIQPGRRIIVSGERDDLNAVTGVHASELAMVSAVSHKTLDDREWASSDTVHTYLTFASPGLQYEYMRNTVTIHGNVAHASHGESRAEVLGSGDASRALQEFPLKQSPLTYVPAPTLTGIASTLEVRVNDLRWHEVPNAAVISPEERGYITRTDDNAKNAVITGFGSRLPSGRDNVRAIYRTGIGAAGNVPAGQISILATLPKGAMGVTNPLATNGGADRDDLAHIRTRTPVGLSALDRLVSARDFEDFTRAFAGIGKAKLGWTDANDNLVAADHHNIAGLVLTIAGENDIPMSEDSSLVRNLKDALRYYGDLIADDAIDPPALSTRNLPSLTVTIRIRRARLIGIRARVRLLPDYLWEAVLPKLQDALIARFGFDAREIGQDVDPSIAIAAMQRVRGVVAVDLQRFGTIETSSENGPLTPANVAQNALNALGLPDIAHIPQVEEIDDGTIAYVPREATGTLLLSLWKET